MDRMQDREDNKEKNRDRLENLKNRIEGLEILIRNDRPAQ